jgi:glycerophosphoryl diester phosphodiesterase
MPSFNLQGHRGARGLKPENTLPSFEAALDVGVSSIETDIHLTIDGIPVLIHDAMLNERICGPAAATSVGPVCPTRPYLEPTGPARQAAPASAPISSLTLLQLRAFRASGNPDPARFPAQDSAVTPLAKTWAEQAGFDPYAIPTLADLFGFVRAYAGESGERAGKTDEQRSRARELQFDLELKRVPFYPVAIGDGFDGESPALLEERVIALIRDARLVERTLVRCFDHRCVRFMKQLEPRLVTAVLIAETAPVSPGDLALQANAQVLCADYRFLDLHQVRQAHSAGILVLPWTVNDPEEWKRLIDWGVDGITTDYPDRLAIYLSDRGIAF